MTVAIVLTLVLVVGLCLFTAWREGPEAIETIRVAKHRRDLVADFRRRILRESEQAIASAHVADFTYGFGRREVRVRLDSTEIPRQETE